MFLPKVIFQNAGAGEPAFAWRRAATLADAQEQ